MDQLTSIINVEHIKIGFSLILAVLSYIKISQIKDQRTNIKKQSQLSIKKKNETERHIKTIKSDQLGKNDGGIQKNKESYLKNSKMEDEGDGKKYNPFQYSNKNRIYSRGQNKSNVPSEEQEQLVDLGSFIKRKYKQKMQSISNPIFPNTGTQGQRIKRTMESEQMQEQNIGSYRNNNNKSIQQGSSNQNDFFPIFDRSTSNQIQENKNIMYCETPKYQRTISPQENINNANRNEEQTIKNNHVRQIVMDNQFPNLNLSLGESSSQQSQSKNKRITKLKSKQHKLSKNANTTSHRALHRINRIGQHRKIPSNQRPPTIKNLNKKNLNMKSTGNLFANQDGYFQS